MFHGKRTRMRPFRTEARSGELAESEEGGPAVVENRASAPQERDGDGIGEATEAGVLDAASPKP